MQGKSYVVVGKSYIVNYFKSYVDQIVCSIISTYDLCVSLSVYIVGKYCGCIRMYCGCIRICCGQHCPLMAAPTIYTCCPQYIQVLYILWVHYPCHPQYVPTIYTNTHNVYPQYIHLYILWVYIAGASRIYCGCDIVVYIVGAVQFYRWSVKKIYSLYIQSNTSMMMINREILFHIGI